MFAVLCSKCLSLACISSFAFALFFSKSFVNTRHLNNLIETLPMGYNCSHW
jgi:hypothetical protein